MSRYEKYETLAQQVFVAEQKRYRRRIAAGRFLLLFLLLPQQIQPVSLACGERKQWQRHM